MNLNLKPINFSLSITMNSTFTGSLIQKYYSLEREKQEEIRQLYAENYSEHICKFPFSVREMFASMVEDAVCRGSIETFEHGLLPGNPEHHAKIVEFLDTLTQSMEVAVEEQTINANVRDELHITVQNFKEFKQKDPAEIFSHIRKLLLFEKEILLDVHIKNIIDELQTCVNQAENTLTEVKNHLQNAVLDRSICEFMELLNRNFESIKTFAYNRIFPMIATWKHEQQKSFTKMYFRSGQPYLLRTVSIVRIQRWCNELAVLIWRSHMQLVAAMEKLVSLPIPEKALHEKWITDLEKRAEDFLSFLHYLMNACFIVEDQPQKIKIRLPFKRKLKVSLLVHPIVLHNPNPPPEVRVYFINEEEAKNYLQIPADKNINTSATFGRAGQVFLSASLTYDENLQRLAVTVDEKSRLDEIRRTTKIYEGRKMAKYCFYIVCEVQVGMHQFRLSTISFPAVVMTHSSQNCRAWATITWDNAFSSIDRVPFEVPDQVSWHVIERILDSKFIRKTGRGLTEENLTYLKSRAFKNQSAEHDMISWNALCESSRDILPFWEYFFSVLKLITNKRTQLKTLWEKGYITGFIGKDTAEAILKAQVEGTFLLRSSDSVAGAISVAVLLKDGKVAHVAPFDTGTLARKHLSITIFEMTDLKYLYQNGSDSITKEIAFNDCYTEATKKKPTRPFLPMEWT